jgi:Xaa-Pro aminopeptidase
MEALEEAIEPGVTEQELGAVFHDTCRSEGATESGGGFIMSAPMTGAELGEGVTWKRPSARPIEEGDIVSTELSATYRGYSAQIHRPYTVGAPPTETYEEIFELSREMYDRSIEALQPGNTPQDVYEAMEPVEESGYKIYDVMSHGYGSGYRHPFVGVEDSNYWPGEIDDPFTAEWTYEPGDVIVIQPNVLTHDETKGLQFGTTVIVTEDGPEVIQEYPAEFTQV